MTGAKRAHQGFHGDHLWHPGFINTSILMDSSEVCRTEQLSVHPGTRTLTLLFLYLNETVALVIKQEHV